MRKLSRSDIRGFTLIELAVVLTLIAIFIGFAMRLAQERLALNQIEITQARMEHVVNIIEKFVRVNGRLPCPANPTLIHTSASYGVEDITGNACNTSGNLESTGGAPNVFAGMLPVVALNLPDYYAVDAWGNKFTYAVDQDLVDEPGMGEDPANQSESVNEEVGDIVIRNWITSSDQNLCSNPTTPHDCSTDAEGAAFVLLSHGPNSIGAWPALGTARQAIQGAEATREQANFNAATTTPAATAAANVGLYYQSLPTTTFDDIVIYRRKWQLPQDCEANARCP